MAVLQVTPFVPGSARGILRRGYEAVSSDSILILTQQELGIFDGRPAGILVMDGAPFSHAMIRLLTLGIPTVLISSETASDLEAGQEVVIDGFRGTITKLPEPDLTITPAPEPPSAGEAIVLNDGSRFLLRASIFNIDDADLAVKQGAAAIGLVRTEYLVPEEGRLPDAAFYERTLRKLCDSSRPLAVTIRLPDIAPDKQVPWLEPLAGMSGPLGMQGVRLYDEEPVRRMLLALLDAVNKVAEDYELKLLLPYVTSLAEFSYWRSRIEQQLIKALPIGTMAESPAAVLALAHWFEVADFVAIGCNDLMQCLFAADRDLAEVRRQLDPYSPELFRFLKQAADAAGDNMNKVQLCGLLPQLPGVLPVLLGMGFRVFSVAPVMIPYLAKIASETNLSQAKALAQQVCVAKTSEQVRGLSQCPCN
jgi:phosphoenolpyruvate-protein kinase (PTS system EI component)